MIPAALGFLAYKKTRPQPYVSAPPMNSTTGNHQMPSPPTANGHL